MKYTLSKAIFILLLIMSSMMVEGATREESIINFIDEMRVEKSGYTNQIGDEVNLKSTVNAMYAKSILKSEINNSLDLLYYFQSLQDETGGFSGDSDSPVNLESTIDAVYGLVYLDVNQSQFSNWKIYQYLNDSSLNLLLTTLNATISINELTLSNLELWYDYLACSGILGVVPTFPIFELIDEIKKLQYANGSYFSLDHALLSVNILNILGEKPVDSDLAKKYILSHRTSDGAFSDKQNGSSSMEYTRKSLNALRSFMNLNTLDDKSSISRFIFNQQSSRSGLSEVNQIDVTIKSTLDGLLILSYLNELDELRSPDVVQEVGFITFSWISIITPIFLSVLWRLKNAR